MKKRIGLGERVFVIPTSEDRNSVVRCVDTLKKIPKSGMKVKYSKYIIRRIKDGSLKIGDMPVVKKAPDPVLDKKDVVNKKGKK